VLARGRLEDRWQKPAQATYNTNDGAIFLDIVSADLLDEAGREEEGE